MDHGLDALLHQELIKAVRLIQIAHDQPLRRYRGAMAEAKVVVNPDLMAAVEEAFDGVGTNVTGAAGD